VRFMRLEMRFAELLGMAVDLVTKTALKPHIGKRFLQRFAMSDERTLLLDQSPIAFPF
jgi:predicted nucleotidyltransferase